MEKGLREIHLTTYAYRASIRKNLPDNEVIKSVAINQPDSASQSYEELVNYAANKNADKALQLLKNLKH